MIKYKTKNIDRKISVITLKLQIVTNLTGLLITINKKCQEKHNSILFHVLYKKIGSRVYTEAIFNAYFYNQEDYTHPLEV